MKETRITLFDFLEQVREPPKMQSAEERIRHFASVYSRMNESHAKAQSQRCIDCGNPYCHWKCPVHNRIPQWLNLVADNELLKAADLAHQTNALPEMCGLLCPQAELCEGACTLNDGLGAVTIGAIEHYLADEALRLGWRPDLSHVKPLPFRVAIIGSGPAGLACADRLARLGVKAEVFEKQAHIGGLLTYGIPNFKLEKHLVLRRRRVLEHMGIVFHTNTDIGQHITLDELLTDFDTVFLAMGADEGNLAKIDGQHLSQVYMALPFLIDSIKPIIGFKEAAPNLKNKTVLILGAGDTAMDCSRTAIRMGAKEVHCVYRRAEKDMHTSQKDYAMAREEGVNFHWYRQAVAFMGDDSLEEVIFKNTQSDDNKTISMSADAAIIAYGFTAKTHDWLKTAAIHQGQHGLIKVNNAPYAMQTSHPKIFAGGDVVLGANLVVNAVAQGQQAAESMVCYLKDNRKCHG